MESNCKAFVAKHTIQKLNCNASVAATESEGKAYVPQGSLKGSSLKPIHAYVPQGCLKGASLKPMRPNEAEK